MSAAHPDTRDKSAASEGTACHALAELILLGEWRGELGDMVEGFAVTSEMYEGALLYARTVQAAELEMGSEGAVIEQKVTARYIHELSGGTPDAYIYDSIRNHLFIGDLKYGFGQVEVRENWQLINYYQGIVERIGTTPRTVTFCIVQPRGYNRDGAVRYWETTSVELYALVDTLRGNAAIALGQNPPVRSGDHCRYCTARFRCDAAIGAGFGFMELAAEPLPVDMTTSEMAFLLEVLQRGQEQIGYLVTGIQEQLEHKINSGERVANYHMARTSSKRFWKNEAGFKAAAAIMGADVMESTVMSPAKAEKLIDKKVVARYTGQSSGMKLKKIDKNYAMNIFSQKRK